MAIRSTIIWSALHLYSTLDKTAIFELLKKYVTFLNNYIKDWTDRCSAVCAGLHDLWFSPPYTAHYTLDKARKKPTLDRALSCTLDDIYRR